MPISEEKQAKAVKEDSKTITIKKDSILDAIPFLNKYIQTHARVAGNRKITCLKWNGPIMYIRGHFYLENISMKNEDLVKKRLVLVNKKNKRIIIPLQDMHISDLPDDEQEVTEPKYAWSAFEGEINFSKINNGEQPLPEDEYKCFIEVIVQLIDGTSYRKIMPLGNVNHFLDQGFHSAKMEFFSSKRAKKFNLMATYDLRIKTLKISSNKLKDYNPTLFEQEKNQVGLFYRAFYSIGLRILYYFFHLFPINKEKILFASDSRSDISGNFEFVLEEMIKRNLDFKYKFMLKDSIEDYKSYSEIIALAYHLATSRFILVDDFYPRIYSLRIRNKAELVQLWHAVGAFKTFGFSRIGLPGGPSPKSKNHRNYSKAIVSSKNVAKYYAEGFGIDEERIIPTGIPRTDIFFDEEYKQEMEKTLYERYPYLKDRKVIMFAPTFRGNGQKSAHYPLEYLDFDRMYYELKDEYVFIFKLHPFVNNDLTIPYQYQDFFYDFSEYREINDLLFITDILITDYSSVCFEFALLNKPMIFFSFDVEEYIKKRDFYFDYQSFIPGPLAKSSEQMISIIKNKEFNIEKIRPFVNYFFDDIDGQASSRVVDWILLEKLRDHEDDALMNQPKIKR